jgi:Putative restriction endonuclease
VFTQPRTTSEKSLELERQTVLPAPARVTKRHNRIARRLLRLLHPFAKGCDVFFAVIKTRVSSGEYQFPDIAVTCESAANDDLIEEPCAIFQIIPSVTGEARKAFQLEEYLKISSL